MLIEIGSKPINLKLSYYRAINHLNLKILNSCVNILITKQHFEKYFTESWGSCLVLQSFFKYFSNYIELERDLLKVERPCTHSKNEWFK